MECVKQKALFVLLSTLLFSLLLAPALSEASGRPKEGQKAPSEGDSSSRTDTSAEESLPGGMSSASDVDNQSGFGQVVHEQRDTHRKGETEKRLRDFVGKRNSVENDGDGVSHPAGSVGGGDTSSDQGGQSAYFQSNVQGGSPLTKRSVDKRLRDFVGKRDGQSDSELGFTKRLRDFVGKRSVLYPSDIQKRLREFVGKRDVPEYSVDVQKRLRDFVGKRWGTVYPVGAQKRHRYFVGKRSVEPYSVDMQKRLRDFVGKREVLPYDVQKRLRDFVGKREAVAYPADVQKRLRDFVGKRNPMPYYGEVQKRLRDFVGKRDYQNEVQKRLRDFVGKRDYENEVKKRLRDFVGKRDYQNEVQKRLRDFVGKRDYENEVQKRLRDFVGKRDYQNEVQKRLRDFVGKRDSVQYDLEDVQKRLRDFVGKRGGAPFFSSDIHKRLRDFVGKRADGSALAVDSPADVMLYRAWDADTADDSSPSSYLSDGPAPPEDSPDMEKRAPIREFVGKRSGLFLDSSVPLTAEAVDSDSFLPVDTASDDDLPLSASKRLRDFVGKRADMDKRLRDFVGKRDSGNELFASADDASPLRATGGAGPVALPLSKRLRDFVGK